MGCPCWMAAKPRVWARWLFPVPGAPKKRASACWVIQWPVASSKTRARFIFLLKSKSKVSRRLPASRKPASVTRRSRSRSCLPADQFVLDQARDEIDWRQLLGLRLDKPGFEGSRDAGAPELAQSALQFDDVHGVTPWVFRAMTSR